MNDDNLELFLDKFSKMLESLIRTHLNHYPEEDIPHIEVVRQKFKDNLAEINDLTKNEPVEKLHVIASTILRTAIEICFEFGADLEQIIETSKESVKIAKEGRGL